MPLRRYLFWCANEHVDFRLPEFEALSKHFSIPLKWVERNTKEPWIVLDLKTESHAKEIKFELSKNQLVLFVLNYAIFNDRI